jgi:hypothetical protein
MRSEPWLKVVPDMRQASARGSSQLYRPWRPGRASSTAATRDKAIIGFPVTGKFMFLLVVRVDFWLIPSVSMMSCCGKTFLPFAVYPCTSYYLYLCHPSRWEVLLFMRSHLSIEAIEVCFYIGNVGGYSLLSSPVTLLNMRGCGVGNVSYNAGSWERFLFDGRGGWVGWAC